MRLECNLSRWIYRLVAIGMLWIGLLLRVQADTYTWGTPGSTGTWSAAGNWYDNTTSATATTAPGVADNTDTVYIDGETSNNSTVIFTTGNITLNALTISSGDTLDLMTSSGRAIFTNGLTNAGTLENAGTISLAQGSGGTGTLTLTNTGTFESVGTKGNLTLDGVTITNTNGTISAITGATINLYDGGSITGGTLSIDSTSSLIDTNVQYAATFSGVTTTNAGTMTWTQTGGGGSSRSESLTITNGSFGNTGTITFNQEGNATGTATHSLDLLISGSNAFTNSNQIIIENTTPDASSKTEYANFTYNPTSGGSLDNTGTITIDNAPTGSAASGSYQYSQMTVVNGGGSSFTNTGFIDVIAGGSNVAQYADLSIADNWTNGGTVIINGAEASLNESGYTYTQSGSGTDTRLLSGATVNAATVNITSGTLEGSGTVSGATTIANGAHLAPGYITSATLAFSSGLTLNSSSNLDFKLDMPNVAAGTGGNSLLTINGNLTLAGLLNISAGSDFTIGNYTLMVYTGTLTNNGLAVNSAPNGYDYSIDTLTTPGSVVLDVTNAPEPPILVLLLLGGVALAFVGTARKLKAAALRSK